MNTQSAIDMNFIMAVWWLHGKSAGEIAVALGITTKTVRGRIERRFQNTREELGKGGRQALLDELKARRTDRGMLPDKFFQALPLKGTQLRKTSARPRIPAPAQQSSRPDPKPVTRREARRLDKEAKRQRKLDELHGRAPRLLAPFEDLVKQKMLVDPLDAPGHDVPTSGRRREEAGLKFRRYLDGTKIGGLKSLNYEGMSGGGNVGLPPAEHRMHCVAVIGQLRDLMTQEEFALLERVIDKDERVWEHIRVRVDGVSRADKDAYQKARAEARARARSAVIEVLMRALDVVAVYEGGLLSRNGFQARWDRVLPVFFKTTRDGAATASRQAAELLHAGRRG